MEQGGRHPKLAQTSLRLGGLRPPGRMGYLKKVWFSEEGLAAGEVGLGAATEKVGEGALSHQPVGDWNLPVWQLVPYKIEDPRMVPNRVFAGKMRLPWHYQHIPQDSIIGLSPRKNEKMSGERKWARKSPPL